MDELALDAAGLAGNAGGGAVAGPGMGAWALTDDTGWLLVSSEGGGG